MKARRTCRSPNSGSSFSGGAQAALATPTACGVYTTTSDFTPWSSPFIPDVFPTSSFAIDSGPDGSCVPVLAAAVRPSMIAGSTTDQAGGFTDFSLLLQRGDGQQRIEKLQFKAPPGPVGDDLAASRCAPNRRQRWDVPGRVADRPHGRRVRARARTRWSCRNPGDPPQPIYLTGPYEGAPFGLSIVMPVIAGPFNLGTIVTRATIAVDPHTAQITVTTDPLPPIVDGVPTDLRTIDAVIDRPGSCSTRRTATRSPSRAPRPAHEGAASPRSPARSRSARAGALKFAPKFKRLDAREHLQSRRGEPHAKKLCLPRRATPGTQANITKVKVDLPEAAALAADDAAEGVPGERVRSQPRELPAAVDRRPREGNHTPCSRCR